MIDAFLSRTFELVPQYDNLMLALKIPHIFMFREQIPNLFGEIGANLLDIGELRLPFNEVFYEFYAKNVFTSRPELTNERFVLYCLFTSHHVNFSISINSYFKMNGKWNTTAKNKPLRIFYSEDKSGIRIERPKEYLDDSFNAILHTFLTATGSLAYSSQKQVAIPTKLHKARRDKPPLYNFRIVELRHSNTVISPPIGTHASPALHWRRGHYRRLLDKIVFVKPCLVGRLENGIVEKMYDATKLGESHG